MVHTPVAKMTESIPRNDWKRQLLQKLEKERMRTSKGVRSWGFFPIPANWLKNGQLQPELFHIVDQIEPFAKNGKPHIIYEPTAGTKKFLYLRRSGSFSIWKIPRSEVMPLADEDGALPKRSYFGGGTFQLSQVETETGSIKKASFNEAFRSISPIAWDRLAGIHPDILSTIGDIPSAVWEKIVNLPLHVLENLVKLPLKAWENLANIPQMEDNGNLVKSQQWTNKAGGDPQRVVDHPPISPAQERMLSPSYAFRLDVPIVSSSTGFPAPEPISSSPSGQGKFVQNFPRLSPSPRFPTRDGQISISGPRLEPDSASPPGIEANALTPQMDTNNNTVNKLRDVFLDEKSTTRPSIGDLKTPTSTPTDSLKRQLQNKDELAHPKQSHKLADIQVPPISPDDPEFRHAEQSCFIKLCPNVFGKVYLGDLRFDGQSYLVAVKDFDPNDLKPEIMKEEARILKLLANTGFVLHLFGYAPSQLSLVQELFGETTISQNVPDASDGETANFHRKAWLNIGTQLAIGLERLLQKGVLSNDMDRDNIKPVVESRSVRYIDIGLGDVYSLGVVLRTVMRLGQLPELGAIVEGCLSHKPYERLAIHDVVLGFQDLSDRQHP